MPPNLQMTPNDQHNIILALKFLIKTMIETTDGSDVIRTGIWIDKMTKTLYKFGGKLDEPEQEKLNEEKKMIAE